MKNALWLALSRGLSLRAVPNANLRLRLREPRRARLGVARRDHRVTRRGDGHTALGRVVLKTGAGAHIVRGRRRADQRRHLMQESDMESTKTEEKKIRE